jgi:hypothetical protein
MQYKTDGILTENDVIRVLKSRSGPTTVKEIVAQLKSFLVSDQRNKDKIRGIIKKVLNHDKASGSVTLKKEYENWKDPALS